MSFTLGAAAEGTDELAALCCDWSFARNRCRDCNGASVSWPPSYEVRRGSAFSWSRRLHTSRSSRHGVDHACRLCPRSRRCTRSSDDGRRASMVTTRQFKSALIAALIFAASAYPGQAQPVSQAPAGNAVPVTADNFNRAETDMYFGKRVKRVEGGGIGNLSHSRELYLTCKAWTCFMSSGSFGLARMRITSEP